MCQLCSRISTPRLALTPASPMHRAPPSAGPQALSVAKIHLTASAFVAAPHPPYPLSSQARSPSSLSPSPLWHSGVQPAFLPGHSAHNPRLSQARERLHVSQLPFRSSFPKVGVPHALEQHFLVVNCINSEARLPGAESCSVPYELCLSLLLCEMGVTIMTSGGR